jgi:DNA mismatch endonuclease (patch repair protein)
MTDVFAPEKRSWLMSHIKGKNTKPEIKVRKMIYSMGYRYRLNVKELPGKPDIVLRNRRKVIFVHGCYWHGHKDCSRAHRPSSNIDFWNDKIEANMRRDEKVIRELKAAGWSVFIVWECQLRHAEEVEKRLRDFLGGNEGVCKR